MSSCPECSSHRVWKDGLRYVQGLAVQRFLCRSCSYRFSENYYKECQTTRGHQICVLDKEAKNLVRAKTKTEALRENEQDTKGLIVSFAWHLKKLGRSNATIRTYTNYVQNIGQYGNLNDPESIKLAIATHFKDRNTKRLACCAYDAFLKFLGIQWEKPIYRPEHRRVFIPTDEELKIIVNSGHKENFVFSLFLYETGARFNEAERLEWTDIDPERNKLSIKASKNGNARIINVSKKLIDLLLNLPKKEQTVFPKKALNSRRAVFRARIKKLARLHSNPRLLKIHFHTLRHCKALREYHKTKSILHVKAVLGHASINTTMRYVELYTEIYGDLQPENYITKVASTKEERKMLIESGFEWVGHDDEGLTYFRKPKC